MGLRNMYIRDVENPLDTLQYSVPNNGYLMRIFKCTIDGFVPAKLPITETPINRISTATDADDKTVYKAEKLDEVVTNCDHLANLSFSYQVPYAFTEFGVSMLASVLRGEKAAKNQYTNH